MSITGKVKEIFGIEPAPPAPVPAPDEVAEAKARFNEAQAKRDTLADAHKPNALAAAVAAEGHEGNVKAHAELTAAHAELIERAARGDEDLSNEFEKSRGTLAKAGDKIKIAARKRELADGRAGETAAPLAEAESALGVAKQDFENKAQLRAVEGEVADLLAGLDRFRVVRDEQEQLLGRVVVSTIRISKSRFHRPVAGFAELASRLTNFLYEQKVHRQEGDRSFVTTPRFPTQVSLNATLPVRERRHHVPEGLAPSDVTVTPCRAFDLDLESYHAPAVSKRVQSAVGPVPIGPLPSNR